MPTLNDQLASKQILRELIYGPAKSKKTWWACAAAEAGFQVFLLDANRGYAILQQLSPEARERVFILDIADELTNYAASAFATLFCKGQPFAWDEANKTPTHTGHIGARIIAPRALNRNCVLVLDSWTDIVTSLALRYHQQNNIDIAKPEELDKRSFFGWTGAMASWLVTALVALPCHVILIGHWAQYEKIKRVQEGNKIKEIPLYERRQIVSSSGPNAMTIPGKFDEVMYFYNHGSAFKIEVEGHKDADGGSRRIPSRTYKWEELQFGTIANIANVTLDPELPHVEFPLIDELAVQQRKKASHGLLQVPKETATVKAGVKTGGLSALFPNRSQ